MHVNINTASGHLLVSRSVQPNPPASKAGQTLDAMRAQAEHAALNGELGNTVMWVTSEHTSSQRVSVRAEAPDAVAAQAADNRPSAPQQRMEPGRTAMAAGAHPLALACV